MKSFNILFATAALLACCGAAQIHADNLIVNGSFETPDVGNNWNLFSNGEVPGWNNTAGDGLIEIDSGSAIGGTVYQGNQSMELNANTFDTVSQQISGLVVGQTYLLSWAYGDRPGSGPQETNVLFGGNLVTTDVDAFAGSNPALVWNLNSFYVTADATTETLSFQAVNTSGEGGSAGEGNEIDAVSLVTPEPATMLLLLTGLGVLGILWRRQALKA